MNKNRKLSALTAITLGLAIPVGGGMLFSSASAVEGVKANPPRENCTPQDYVAPVDAVLWKEHEFTRTVKVPGNGLPQTIEVDNPDYVAAVGEPKITVDNPNYVAPVAEQQATYATEYKFVHKLDWLQVNPKWNEDPNWNKGQGWVNTGVTRQGRQLTPYVAPVAEVGPKQIEVDNPNYQPAQGDPKVTVPNPEYVGETTKTETFWVREDKVAELDRGAVATGNVRDSAEVKTPAVEEVLADTCETTTIAWVMPEGGTPDNVTWPQLLAVGDECGVWLQVDLYKYGTEAEKAYVHEIVADETLTGPAEDGPVYLSHEFVQTDDCETEEPPVDPEDPTDPEEPETPVDPEQPQNPVEPDEGDEETPVVVTPVVNVQPVVQPVVKAEEVTPVAQDELAETGVELNTLAIGAAGLVATGALGLVVASNVRRNRQGRHERA